MFDNLFTSSPSVWAGLVAGMVAIPILIHLINLMRHKTVHWAAMEFLLKSYKKNRNWVWLKQLLLLLSRIAVLVLALLMLAQIGCHEDRISKLLGGATTHHYVLLDDSFSMSDRGSGGSAFERARSTLTQIAARATNRQNQRFSLLRYSNARSDNFQPPTISPDTAEHGEQLMSQLADINGELVDSLFDQRIEDAKARLTVSNLSTGISDALTTVSELIKNRTQENAIIYVLSDFRERDWANPTETEELLSGLHSTGAAIEFINCAKTTRPNLAITELVPVGNVRVGGTPLMMKLTVKNCSTARVEKIQIKLGALAFQRPSNDAVPADLRPDYTDLPAVFVQSIGPGESETRLFPVFFNTAGKHVVVATLPDDAVAADNQRWNVTNFSDAAKILMVDNQDQQHSRILSLALSPSGMTGIEPDFRTKGFLRDTTPESLLQYDVLFLLDMATLDESAIRNVESFAAAGGGVAFFVGPETNLSHYNSLLYRNGSGIFPLPLEKTADVPEQLDERVPDVTPTFHPMFAPVLNMKSSLLDYVQIKRILQPPLEWSERGDKEVTVLATVRGNSDWPLIVEQPFGKGRVMAFLTTAGPVWNNWTGNATFPPIALLMQDYLATGKYTAEDRLVGSTVDIKVPANDYTPNITMLVPGGDEDSRLVNKETMGVSAESPNQLWAQLGKRLPAESTRETDLPGIYDVYFRKTDSTQSVERFTLNVDPSESELSRVNPQKLLAALETSRPTLVDWDQFNPEPKQKPASSLSRLLLILFVGTMVAEQALAYSASYHRK